jgi:mono/diheme cytochrome c family protein
MWNFSTFFAAGAPISLVASAAFAAPAAAPLPADHAQRMAKSLEMFQKDVSQLLKEHCLKCHGGEKTKGDFDLSTREDLLKGGKEGAAIVPFDSKSSPMMKLIRHEEDPAMPDKKPKLPDDVINKIADWIDNGASYSEPLIAGKKPNKDRSVVTDEDKQWWAFKPLAKVTNLKSQNTNPIDELLLEKARAKGLKFNAPADPRVLIRRVYLDLTGLPPSPEEVETFVQSAVRNPKSAMDELVSKLLDSPRYGERWARHWLDVARFAESSGFEHDYDRPFAFHYRDFVIKALNQDMPYDQFVRWQLAGDEYEPENPMALAATGFLGAGVYPTQITANEVERVRYDALDDMLSTTSNAFLGLTVGCARCHDHKYDPIPTRDYYRMLSTFTTTVRSNIDVELNPEKTKPLKEAWEIERKKLADTQSALEQKLQPAFDQWVGSGMTDAGKSVWTILEPAELKSSAKAKFKPLGDGSYLVEGENGAWDTYTITAKTSQRHLTGLKLEALTHPSMKRNGPGRAPNGNFGLAKITISAAPANGGEEQDVKISKAVADYEQNKTSLSVAGSLDEDSSSGWAVDGQIGKDHAAVFTFERPLDMPEGVKLTIKLSFSVNTQHNIGRPRFSLMSDAEPTLKGGVLAANVATAMERARNGGGADKLNATDRKALFDWWKQRDAAWQDANKKLADVLAKEPSNKTTMMICGEGYKPIRMHTQGADFLEETYFLKRGNAELKDGIAPPGFMQVLMKEPDEKRWQWQAPKEAKFSGRRRTLSNWMTDVEHGSGALLARVIVNRLWQHHFGRGIVSTPNDFGKQGTLPSQPELLDWLANELIRNGWKLKPIHKLIMLSAAYQQGTALDSENEKADPANDFFMRRMPQRLEAESVRDSMLAVSGALDETMFGAGTRDEASRRRSIYFNIKRSQLIGSMVAFDAPEPLVSQGARPTTTVAPQALMLMNSPQVRSWAEALAKRIETDCEEKKDVGSHVARAYAICFGRVPSHDESSSALAFIAQQAVSYDADKKSEAPMHALADFCQVLFGLNEFVYAN